MKGKGDKAKKYGSEGSEHTGPVDHPDMNDHLKGAMGKDPHASAEHHKGNREAGMTNSLGHAEEEYDRGQHHGKGKSMDTNETHDD